MATEELIEKQKLIREGLALTLYGEFRGTFDRDSISRQNAFADADRALKYLTEKGAVLLLGMNAAKLVEEFQREHRCLEHPHDAWDAAHIAIDYLSSTATAPLIEE